MKENIFKFHLPWRKTISVALFVFFASLMWKAKYLDSVFVALIVLNYTVALIGIWFISTIHITSEGIVLYHINKCKWSNIVSAKYYVIFGLPHIRIKRTKGMPWSFPLYFVGDNSIKESLLKYVPQDSSLYETANTL